MVKGYEVDPKRMSFLEHLGELRMLLIHVAIIAVAGTAAAWAFSGRILDWLIVWLHLGELQILNPLEGFNTRFKIALAVGLCVTCPLVALRIWAFVAPALRLRERRIIIPSSIATTVLFASGIAFSLTVLTPIMLDFLKGFGTEKVHANLALAPTLSFVFQMSIACAIVFQLPMVLGITTFMGLTSPRWLLSRWRHAVVLIFILAAVVTPGDGWSQVILAIPLVVLYFLSVLVSAIIWRSTGRTARHDAPAADPDPAAGPSSEEDE